MKPRWYQVEAHEALINCLWNEPEEAPVVAIPTGAGKSLTIAMVALDVLQRVPRARIVIATHSKELVSQNAKTLQRYWPQAPFGVYSAGLGSKEAAMPITLANIQSMARNIKAFGKIAIFIVDEAHLIAPGEETNYQRVISALRITNPNMVVVGFTATPFRLGQGLLTNGNIFTKFCYNITGRKAFVRLVDEGFLAPLIPKRTNFKLDVSRVKIVDGDFNQTALQHAVNTDRQTLAALEEAVQVAASRKHWLIYCSGIEHIESVTSMLSAFGEDAVAVHSKMADEQYDTSMDRFRSGQARMIVSDGMLTTGVDFPHVDCIMLLRPTASPVLHVQILGRGTRPNYAAGFDLETIEGRLAAIAASDKQNCLVLDFAGNVERLGPINDPRVPKMKGEGKGDVPVKLCPVCGTYVHAAQRFCDGVLMDDTKCTHEFEFHTKLEQTAATIELIARDAPEMHWFPVDRIEYEQYTKPFSPSMMRVKYYCGMRRFTEMVCIEHSTYAGKVARNWWRDRLPTAIPPTTTHDGMALVDQLRVPTHIYVQTNTQWPKILRTSFDQLAPPDAPAMAIPSYARGDAH